MANKGQSVKRIAAVESQGVQAIDAREHLRWLSALLYTVHTRQTMYDWQYEEATQSITAVTNIITALQQQLGEFRNSSERTPAP